MLKLFSILFLSAILLSCNQQSKVDKNKEGIDAVCDKIMENLKNWQIPEACNLLKQNCIIITQSDIDTLQNSIMSQGNSVILPNYGKPISYELAVENKTKDIAAKRYYVLKFKKYFIKISFTLYNNGTKWTIANFVYDDDTQLL